MSRSDREGRLPCEGAGLPSYGKTEGVLQIDKIRMRFALIRTCQRAALSVICFANASSPKGRAEKPVQAESLTNQGDFDTDLFVRCSFRHGLRRATFLREEGFGFPRSPACLSLWERCRAATERAGSLVRELACRLAARLREFCQIEKIRMRFALIRIWQCVLPSQSFAAQMPALPKGEPRSRCGLGA